MTRQREKADYDVVIIGSGVGGGAIALSLADTGARILITERGERLPSESENWDAESVFVQQRYRTNESWVDGAGNAFRQDNTITLVITSSFTARPCSALVSRISKKVSMRTAYHLHGRYDMPTLNPITRKLLCQ